MAASRVGSDQAARRVGIHLDVKGTARDVDRDGRHRGAGPVVKDPVAIRQSEGPRLQAQPAARIVERHEEARKRGDTQNASRRCFAVPARHNRTRHRHASRLRLANPHGIDDEGSRREVGVRGDAEFGDEIGR